MSTDPNPFANRLTAVRHQLEARGLRRTDLAADPIEQVQRWWADAVAAGLGQPEALALATADEDGRPSVRFVLVRGLDQRGLAFFTNHESRKGRELDANPWASGVLAWHGMGRQVRVTGPVVRASAADADAYWATRSRSSQLAAWASPQSAVVPDRDALEMRFAAEEERWEGREVERPPNWGGYRLVPAEVEVWQGRADRFHDRFRYERVADGGWRIDRLGP
jgi:pyridoxamine 5'-phosphate oxidase